jgi:hypothetical protein
MESVPRDRNGRRPVIRRQQPSDLWWCFCELKEAKSRAAVPEKLWTDEAVRAAMGAAASAHSNRRMRPRLVGIADHAGRDLRTRRRRCPTARCDGRTALVRRSSGTRALHHLNHPTTRRRHPATGDLRRAAAGLTAARLRVLLLPTGWKSACIAGPLDPEEISLGGPLTGRRRVRITGWGRRAGVFGLSAKYLSSPLPRRYVGASKCFHQSQRRLRLEAPRSASIPLQPCTATAGRLQSRVEGRCLRLARPQRTPLASDGGLDCEG